MAALRALTVSSVDDRAAGVVFRDAEMDVLVHAAFHVRHPAMRMLVRPRRPSVQTEKASASHGAAVYSTQPPFTSGACGPGGGGGGAEHWCGSVSAGQKVRPGCEGQGLRGTAQGWPSPSILKWKDTTGR